MCDFVRASSARPYFSDPRTVVAAARGRGICANYSSHVLALSLLPLLDPLSASGGVPPLSASSIPSPHKPLAERTDARGGQYDTLRNFKFPSLPPLTLRCALPSLSSTLRKLSWRPREASTALRVSGGVVSGFFRPNGQCGRMRPGKRIGGGMGRGKGKSTFRRFAVCPRGCADGQRLWALLPIPLRPPPPQPIIIIPDLGRRRKPIMHACPHTERGKRRKGEKGLGFEYIHGAYAVVLPAQCCRRNQRKLLQRGGKK